MLLYDDLQIWRKSLISNTDFSILENNFLEIFLLKTVNLNLISKNFLGHPGSPRGWWWWEHVISGCYGHSKPGFKIKFEITIFEIRDYRF
jgi:hypothetical protein